MDPSDTLSSSADFPVLPVIRPTQLPPFPVGTRRVSPVARCVLVVVPSLTTPPERPAASIGLRQAVLPSPSRLRARPPGLLTYGATSRSLSLRPDNSHSPEVRLSRGFRPSVSLRPALQLRGFRFLPRQDCLLLNTPAFPGRATVRAPFNAHGSSSWQGLLRSSEDFLTELANKLDGRTPVNGVPVARALRRAYGYLFAWLLHRRAPQWSSVNHQSEVSTLSGQASRPYPAGYMFPSPFGCRHSLPPTSLTRWGLVPPLQLAYRETNTDPNGLTTLHRMKTGPG